MIKTIVFDLGNVLIPFDYSIMINKLNNIQENLGNYYYNWYKTNYHYHRDFEKGLISENEFIDLNLNTLNYLIDKNTFCKYYSEIFIENRKVTSLLPELKQKYKLVLLSNTNSIHKKFGWEQYKFLENFDHLVLSYEVKYVKPEKEIYLHTQNIFSNQPQEIFYIDDVLEYIQAAHNIGWNTYHFDNEENCKKYITNNLL
ncbi:MAG TPA: HAD family phosphatase [Ignavibacteriales bacterium]|nr:HAD family phosphatase [Ignavibacteriales bacterium]HOL81881.1 HAD family phosphatase [Ignavibacteriales bacterium]HOM65018.1 HAD family phosphatase [Ignavibacteriales bacterium]HPD67250.1 HAD family phosphatase [Ignavibacteriales bacterium]HPP33982.1 HAD family phosphatase [Ignavibacteriales bacterium]